MKVLIIGNGGREHAIAWKIAQSPQVEQIFVAPGNGGTALEAKTQNIAINATDIDALVEFAKQNQIDFTLIGPEAPLALGIVDHFTAANLPCFGPTKACAQLESSKTFCKDFLARHQIPTARYQSFTDLEKALAYVQAHPLPVVIKADGLAAGKGVVIANTLPQAAQALTEMLADDRFGSAGKQVVVEEFLHGEEASFITMVDGEHVLCLATSQDHKALLDGDKGPNTGGMGAYSPAPVVTPELHQRIMREVITPTVAGMRAEGHPFTGFLYAGLMINTAGEPKVLEFNCRLGDPETQPLMMRLDSDLLTLCQAALDGRLDQVEAKWKPETALGVVLAAPGYPENARKGDEIFGLPNEDLSEQKVFHAGTIASDALRTAGGRVLCVTALGQDINAARLRAYKLVEKIHWPDMQYRTDIGYRAIKRQG